jgi:hypothetical protein
MAYTKSDMAFLFVRGLRRGCDGDINTTSAREINDAFETAMRAVRARKKAERENVDTNKMFEKWVADGMPEGGGGLFPEHFKALAEKSK